MTTTAPLRSPCPPGACVCGRDPLLDTPGADLRILRLTRNEEKVLLARLEQLKDLDDLRHLQKRMYEQLGIRVEVSPGFHEVRTMLGIDIDIDDLPGLCRKTRKAIPTAIRRGLNNNPAIAFELLNAHDLLRDA
ncbi:hypothetical protein JRG42_18860 [Pseudomonas granadensis]|uniref:Ribosomal protein S3AE n=1 Tax=Pseudomonas granadensis TaxID=1421430 RepID=A0ABX7GLP6_9PSED|nr:hypothetical protein [Pseudomonas granadensis]MBN6772661.1 hypothetical protein [Pseudomonas granadensis]MBN6806399.1 hypothetical protein [Pseudomonas granadensis]MBN6830978.1 hypothetical protein [Pseudomonas granadensis]MBN6840740.1 hypothetical protein [Pseudomonas granadensis]MBN6867882.1 hypothetical protein [Pseudomonas granadensis]